MNRAVSTPFAQPSVSGWKSGSFYPTIILFLCTWYPIQTAVDVRPFVIPAYFIDVGTPYQRREGYLSLILQCPDEYAGRA
jgi:hypothetical protein